jgi:hypothetical protein
MCVNDDFAVKSVPTINLSSGNGSIGSSGTGRSVAMNAAGPAGVFQMT